MRFLFCDNGHSIELSPQAQQKFIGLGTQYQWFLLLEAMKHSLHHFLLAAVAIELPLDRQNRRRKRRSKLWRVSSNG